MRISIYAVARMRRGPEQELIDHYTKLLRGSGPQVGITDFAIHEVDDRKGPPGEAGQNWQADQLLQKIPRDAFVIALDENGQTLTSTAFAKHFQKWQMDYRDIAFVIGGPDGHGRALLNRAHFTWALGKATWPHMLARVLVTEQLYRTCCILTGHPYHHG